MATRKELIDAVGQRHRRATYSEERHILDEFVALTHHHRKHAIRLLRRQTQPSTSKPARRRVYDEAVWQALVALWEAGDRVCGKRLKTLIPILIGAMERHGHLSLNPIIRGKLLAPPP